MSDGASGQRLRFPEDSCLRPRDAGQEWLRDERLEQQTSREEHRCSVRLQPDVPVIVIESSSSMDSGPADWIADGVSRQLDPRWIMVQRVHFAILLIIL